MKLNQVYHGFELIRIRESAELNGTLYEMRHLKTGAELAYLDNNENNKLFSVAFKTLPWDDTGVFHILEHSVLAGSENFPVKEPFLDLLKSSMNTFLNAMTFPDKTMYPVSSRNEQDFLNLVTVYLDAVFKPSIYTNESIFRQEGWHYEITDGVPSYNGVVFNEMKGALSSVYGLMQRYTLKYLFPESIYGFESGGEPKAIPDLTYKNFLKAHSEFYSPSNARFYLDGAVPLERVLELIDGKYLSRGEFVDEEHSIAFQTPVKECEKTEYYEIGKEESEEKKTYISYSKIFASWQERKRIMAYSLISAYLTDSNESPLKRAILEKRLAQDVAFYIEDGIAQPFYTVVFKNTDTEKKEDIKAVYKDVLAKIIAEGIDKDELTAYFNQFEFSLREVEEPAGLTRNINALNSWLYGGDMLLYLENNGVLSEMREAINTDYYEKIIAELLDFENSLTLIMLPSKTKGDEDRKLEEARVNAEYNAFSEDEKAHIKAVYDNMRTWQDTPDSPEATATLPVLSLKDVKPEPLWLDTEAADSCGAKMLFHKLDSNGIVHCNMYFNIADAGMDKLQPLSLLCELLSVLPTENYTPSELQKEIKKTIGSLDFSVEAYPDYSNPLRAKPYFTVSFSVLENNLAPALDLIGEILMRTDFNNKKIIKENVVQVSEDLYRAFIGSGHMYAIKRALARTSAASRVYEVARGYECLNYLRAVSEEIDKDESALVKELEALAACVFTSSRLTFSETSSASHSELLNLVSALPSGEQVSEYLEFEAQPPVKEAIFVPSGVSYAAYGSNIQQYGYTRNGMLNVTALLLTYGYLWNEIRVHGGAYGCGFRCPASGNTSFHSYRDPNPLNSVEVYKNTAEFIKQFVESDEDVDRYIISSVASTEPLLSPSRQGADADILFLTGYTYEDKLKTRTEMLSVKKEELLTLCPLFEKMRDGSSVCIIGNEEALASADSDYKTYRL